ncbi:MAG: DEAD/DEAH box helicase [Phycisphaerales bacterium JB052]
MIEVPEQGVERSAMVIHANWSNGALHLWCEQPTPIDTPEIEANDESIVHRHAVRPVGLPDWVQGQEGTLTLRLPAFEEEPIPSVTMSRLIGRDQDEDSAALLREFTVPTLAVDPIHAGPVLEWLAEHGDSDHDESEHAFGGLGAGIKYFVAASRLASHLLAGHRVVPMILQDAQGELSAGWWPWLSDPMTAARVQKLVNSMPGVGRAVVNEHAHDAWSLTTDFLAAVTDARCRSTMIREEMHDTVEDADPERDPQVAWLLGLLDDTEEVPSVQGQRADIVRKVRRWISELEDRGESSDWVFGLRIAEPIADGLAADISKPDATVKWSLSFFLQSVDDEEIVLRASDIWLIQRERIVISGLTLENPQELLMAELGRASRHYKKLEEALDSSEPIEILLDSQEAYAFLRENKPILEEQGFAVQSPPWWESPSGRLGARLKIESDPAEAMFDENGDPDGAAPQLGLNSLVGYHWEIAIGDTTLTLHEFEQLAQQNAPLVRIGGKWVEIRPEDVQNAIKFIGENPGGEMELGEAMQLALASDSSQTGLPVTGLEATGWVASLLGGEDGASIKLPELETPERFNGTLRPYQSRGMSWMSFMEQFGFGACLADDMGLGKTVQMLALMVHERTVAPDGKVDPTLLVVPMSVIGNWMKEAQKFAPQLRVMVHHGVDRHTDETFSEVASNSDLILTTYALAHRDREIIDSVKWGRIVLDEAQFIKNPAAKQSQAVRSIVAPKRVALTGTPVENRLSELWSIMDFLNPGYLGSSGLFRKRFSLPIERHRDQNKMVKLRAMVSPFILRRVKTDPTVVSDLPSKIESKEWCALTPEQAKLYESCVQRMLSDVDQSEGIHRRGLVLAALIKLKQICNHPAQMLKETDPQFGKVIDPMRSGKCVRLLEQTSELISEGDQALIFTQFRQMGHILSNMLRHELGKDVLFLHGGTPQGKRQKMIDEFQEATGKTPILILSLKAGGVGLNLTAATHVFHFDRWWNPAVENQATDRAYRIGQTRTVQVHKYIVRGTLEERIDEMIESKMELAENIIGHGERWLTELGTDKLRELLTLRADTIADEM